MLINQSRAGATFPFIVLLTTKDCLSTSEEFRDIPGRKHNGLHSDPDWQYPADEGHFDIQNSKKL
jgi:hypothetical protein